jgi:casein kinase II subunit beta
MNDVDGSFFGCSFPHLFMAVFPELEPIRVTQEYIPRIYGFKVHRKKGSTFRDETPQDEMYYYGEEHIKRLAQQ